MSKKKKTKRNNSSNGLDATVVSAILLAMFKSKPRLVVVACILIVIISIIMPARCNENECGLNSAVYGESELAYVITNPELDSRLIEYSGMTISFNQTMHVPNWVAYELTADEADGTEPRYNKFMVDENVSGCATPDDYRNTGFDRGHMAPAADMKWSQQAMMESFYMTNIAPQANVLNRGTWSKLEDKCRGRARKDSAVIIISGPVLNADEIKMHIGANGVAVPSRFFKVILSPYTNPPVAIGFIVPNGPVEGGMQACAVTVDSVESVTGHDFFSALPDDIETAIESKVNFNKWSRLK